MRFPKEFLEDVRARLSPSQIVGAKVRLKRAGRTFKGLCPFHAEKTPSFVVDDQRGTWHCFGCSEGGDIFAFLMRSEGRTFAEAVTQLAGMAGVALPHRDPDAVKREARKLTLVDLLDEAQRFYVDMLARNPEARAYLAGRGVSRETIARFGIGYAPDDRSPLRALNADRALMLQAGLVTDAEVQTDRFRHRITFPIRDLQSRIVGFGGRTLGDHPAKYLNTAETEIFRKGSLLFNADRARPLAHDGAPLLVVEGYFDVATVSGAGFAAVSTMGTAVTEDQLLGLWRLSDTPIFCFDGDAAGQKAMARTIRAAFPLLRAGRSLKFITLPSGDDPDTFVRERGADDLSRAVTGATGVADTFWRLTIDGRPTASVEDQAAIEREMIEAFASIPDEGLRRKYERDARQRVFNLARRLPVIRSNGHSLHSTNPGSIRLTHGIEAEHSFTLKEAALVASLFSSPWEADIEREIRGVSDRTKQVLSEIHRLLGSVPETEMRGALAERLGAEMQEVYGVLHRAGITAFDVKGEA